MFKQTDPASESHICEVFSTFLFKKLGVNNFVRYEFAKMNGDVEGTVCKSFMTEDDIIQFDGYDILFENYCIENNIDKTKIDKVKVRHNVAIEYKKIEIKAQSGFGVELMMRQIEKYCKYFNYLVDLKKLERQLNQLYVIDYFLCQSDRRLQNINFTIQEKNNKKVFIMCPMFDNGSILGLGYDLVRKKPKEIKMRFSYSTAIPQSPQMLESRYFSNGGILANDILDIIKTDENANQLFKKFMTLDIEAEISEFEECYDIQIPDNYKSNMITLAEERVQNIYEFVERINKRLKYKAQPLELNLS